MREAFGPPPAMIESTSSSSESPNETATSSFIRNALDSSSSGDVSAPMKPPPSPHSAEIVLQNMCGKVIGDVPDGEEEGVSVAPQARDERRDTASPSAIRAMIDSVPITSENSSVGCAFEATLNPQLRTIVARQRLRPRFENFLSFLMQTTIQLVTNQSSITKCSMGLIMFPFKALQPKIIA